jgi:hypothetical protein
MTGIIPQQVQAQITAIENALDGNNQNTRDFVTSITQRLNQVNAEIGRLNRELNDARALAERSQQQQPMPPLPPTAPSAPNAQLQDCQQYIQVINELHERIGHIIGKLENDIGTPINNMIQGFGGNGSNNGGGEMFGGLFSSGGGGQRGGSRRRRKMHSKKRKHHRSRKI